MVDTMKKNAFTLLELLGVLFVIGLIALIAVPSVSNVIENSRNKLYKTQLNTKKTFSSESSP